jgi:hypothetical protein
MLLSSVLGCEMVPSFYRHILYTGINCTFQFKNSVIDRSKYIRWFPTKNTPIYLARLAPKGRIMSAYASPWVGIQPYIEPWRGDLTGFTGTDTTNGMSGLMKIAIYFSGKLILFLFHPPPPPNPLPQGEGGLSLPFRKGVGTLDIHSPSPCGRGSGGGGWWKLPYGSQHNKTHLIAI